MTNPTEEVTREEKEAMTLKAVEEAEEIARGGKEGRINVIYLFISQL